MTKASLAHATADELEKMTDAELLVYFEPVLHITRPERASIEAAKSSGKNGKKVSTVDEELAKARAALKQFGLDGIL